MPFTVEPDDEERGDEQHPHQDDQGSGDLVEQFPVIVEGRADLGGGQAEQDEDRGEAGNEDRGGNQYPAPVVLFELLDRQTGDRREITGDERQHAGGEERDHAGEQGGDQADAGGGVGGGGQKHGGQG